MFDTSSRSKRKEWHLSEFIVGIVFLAMIFMPTTPLTRTGSNNG